MNCPSLECFHSKGVFLWLHSTEKEGIFIRLMVGGDVVKIEDTNAEHGVEGAARQMSDDVERHCLRGRNICIVPRCLVTLAPPS